MLMMTASSYASGNFATEKYMINADVGEDASIKMTEKISVDIFSSMHGIYRYIPLSNRVTYKDDDGSVIKSGTVPIKITGISAGNDPYIIETENGNKVIRIGDEDEYVSGKKTYHISYDVQLYDDGVDQYDSLYYNFLPDSWETPVGSAGITVRMPKAFDESHLNVYYGRRGSAAKAGTEGDVTYSVKGNVIHIKGSGLEQGAGITVALRLPDGYFKGMPGTEGMTKAAMIFAALMALCAVLLWLFFGRDRKLVKTVEFEAPDGITPAEIGYIVDGKVDKEDVVSLIFYFAEKGYITIEEREKDDFVLHKEKELPDDAKPFERTLFGGLFAQGNGKAVVLKDIDETFYDSYKTSVTLVESEYADDEKKRIFPKSSILSRSAVGLAAFLGFLAAGFCQRALTGDLFSLFGYILPFALLMGANVFGAKATDKKYSVGKGRLMVYNVVSLVLLVLACCLASLMTEDKVLSVVLVIMCVCAYFAARFMMRRTKYGAEITGRILGFRNFIETAETDKLRALVEEDPEYFFNILPYAYVMGLSKKWAKKFETIPTKEPYWYRGYGRGDVMFNTWLFYSAFNRCADFAGSTIKIPQNESSGSFGGGGGGFSGGGFGGGGGGGW